MTKKMNQLSAKQWAEERERLRHEAAEAERIKVDLDALRSLRAHLLNNGRGEPTQTLIAAVDDYAGFLTGDRQALWSGDFMSIHPDNRK